MACSPKSRPPQPAATAQNHTYLQTSDPHQHALLITCQHCTRLLGLCRPLGVSPGEGLSSARGSIILAHQEASSACSKSFASALPESQMMEDRLGCRVGCPLLMKQRGIWVLVEDSPGYLAFIFPNLVLRHSNQAASCHPASSARAPAQPLAFSDSTCKQWTPSQQVSLHVYVRWWAIGDWDTRSAAGIGRPTLKMRRWVFRRRQSYL